MASHGILISTSEDHKIFRQEVAIITTEILRIVDGAMDGIIDGILAGSTSRDSLDDDDDDDNTDESGVVVSSMMSHRDELSTSLLLHQEQAKGEGAATSLVTNAPSQDSHEMWKE